MPPAVGSGCKHTSVATGALSAGRASSPIRFRPSAVRSVMVSRTAGSTVLAIILVMSASPVSAEPRPGPARPPLPARIVPVPALVRSRGVLRPDHHVRRAWPDLLVAARAPVHLGGRGAWHPADYPDPVRPFLGLRRTQPGRRPAAVAVLRGPGRAGRPGRPARPARGLSRQAAGLARAHGR